MNLFRGMCTAAEGPIWVAAHLRVRGHHVARANLGSTPVLSRRNRVVVAEALGLEPPGASALYLAAHDADSTVTGRGGGFTRRPVSSCSRLSIGEVVECACERFGRSCCAGGL